MPRRPSSHRIGQSAGVLSIALLLALGSALFAPVPALRGQQKVDALSDAEVEKLRDVNREPADRVMVFVGFLDSRTDRIRDITAKPRRPGREEDIHDLMEQFVSIADDLQDNLDEYGTRHWDVRKALPKLSKALDKWATTLRSPADDEHYDVERKLALEAIQDIREDSDQLLVDQKAWFAAHPPAKDAQGSYVPQ
jgi:hypothetical protein